jgi:ATP-dependent DNA helicase RecQ
VEKIERGNTPEEKVVTGKKVKPEKGSSKNESLAFYKQGMKVPEIAKQRDMSPITIEGHLAEFVQSGEVNVFDFVTKKELEKAKAALEKLGDEKLTPLINELGSEFNYGKLRMALAFLKNSNNPFDE